MYEMIQLTGADDKTPIFFMVRNIESISASIHAVGATNVDMVSGASWLVTETPSQILRQIPRQDEQTPFRVVLTDQWGNSK